MRKLVVFSGAGMSAESGINTFRDSDGLWEKHRVEDVASPEAWARNPELVQRFYNERRKKMLTIVHKGNNVFEIKDVEINNLKLNIQTLETLIRTQNIKIETLEFLQNIKK